MALEGPRLRYVRAEDAGESEDKTARALRLAREIQDLLDDPHVPHARMACAMAASLVDELEALSGGGRKRELS
jgi:hypothetical protein